MSRPAPGPPVLVLPLAAGHWQHGVLGIARTLGRLGVPVFMLAGAARTPVTASRYLEVYERAGVSAASGESLLRSLERFTEIHGEAILLPADDEAALFVSAHANRLRARFRFPAQPPGLAARLSDKREMARLCAEHGVPTPWISVPESAAELAVLAGDVRFPVIVKGIDGARLARRTGERMRIARDGEGLRGAFADLQDPDVPNLIVQEYIPGGAESVWMLNAYFDAESECRLVATGRKLRQFPPRTGVTTLGECVPNPRVEATTLGFMKRLGYSGILDIGYRYDARDDTYKLLDVNPRVGATFRLFAAAGLDVVRALYLDLTGEPVPAVSPPPGRRWLVENFDAASGLAAWRDGDLSPRRWLGSLRGVDEAAWFARDDLAPFARMAARSAGRATARVRRAARGRTAQSPGGSSDSSAASTRSPSESSADSTSPFSTTGTS